MSVDLIVRDARIATPDGLLPPGTAIAVDDGEIAGIGREDALPNATEIHDADGNLLLPGIVDGTNHNSDERTSPEAVADATEILVRATTEFDA